ncbi:NAC domain-containing protein 83 [Herrania umbratica]|uniref:NAC domain-containing protein 83 n=1 Tax=Herrania umbratica TaxID=108875 RepID=A0A6J1AH30_9ROSI|nr:NAC domain-containing protein 83 [Herrania umbratica]XP_021286150.1 NAC domain-containing protein 83 [Herrania umbratica]XP_021286151.1 NAC domain-containing protein 83 [Herrania umbratica]
MNKLNFVREGVTKLPPGFRFQPTDEELVFQYLKCKVFSFPLPASIIPEINVCNYDPWDLPGESEQERFFFSSKEAKYRIGNRINRATASGYWKATGLDKQITSRRYQIAGMRKTLVFHMGKPPHGSRTDWIMHEYRLVTVASKDCNSPLAKNPIIQNFLNHHMEKWVVCRIFVKKRSKRSEDEIIQSFCNNNHEDKKSMAVPHEPKFFYFMREKSGITPASSSSSSSSSSSITEISSSGADLEESSSHNIVR